MHFFFWSVIVYFILFYSAHLIGDGNDGAQDAKGELESVDFDSLCG